MGLARRFWDFLNKPLFLSKASQRDLVLDSEEYSELTRENQRLDDENQQLTRAINACQDTEIQYADFMSRTIIESAKTEQELKGAIRKIKQLKGLEDLARLGEAVRDLSKVGVLSINKDYQVVDINETACRYLDLVADDLIGIDVSSVVPDESYLQSYFKFFKAKSEMISVVGHNLDEFVFKIGEVGFDVQGFYVPLDDSKEYAGGFILITPYKEKSFLEKIFGKRSVVVAPDEPLVKERFGVLCPLVERVRYKEVDLTNSCANEEALKHLADYYKHFNGGKFVFKGVSEFEKAYLMQEGVPEEDILSIRKTKSAEDTGEYPAIQGA